MCFSIPYRVEKIKNGTAIIEGRKKVKVGREIRVKKGEYLQVMGNLAVAKISKKEGLKIRNLIKTIYDGE
ncbi:hypothetical protein A3D78_02080 [Candidatus Gottesmanbacteria bacterium RIFCSPHIGHO2_02_FULL_39_14]|uniref:HypC/HybG/HupF family hydrogenase formation chaperone n=3 Tax=Candidatus Gottesmaniibacteriota TaxID=1752720 RepID=A0A1F6A2S9_9BACT|nr:MAG: hypothetical protein A2153_04790 [Candidatus Gottesmanbacteria bacterium RBG_16_38_7b]OGG18782.1 MAG: hypothetical protein A3D78_02080 [Candidatus Gottesmanbacteria bacterium RIFCSPHIGHO2_02_FULL_39_14]OGG31071.1 MAG: hypothetical protein A3I51_02965 [Candidatus Gottesmanbacteria bacterium RIFCSPLOWO2_02_FULL_38_8]